jgi:putative FmdB family regulatory protein
MPTYQYRCTDCGHDLEAVQKFSDASLTECPNCGGSLRKVFNAVGVVFKGSGFYRTDSRNGATNGAGPGSSEKAAQAAEKSKSNDDSKPATKEPARPKANGSNGKQPVGSGASSTGGTSAA